MKNPSNNFLTTKLNAQTCVAIVVILILAGAALLWPMRAALAQGDNGSQQHVKTLEAARTALAPIKNSDEAGGVTDEQVFSPAPELVTATSYPFTNAGSVALEDMSSGTTQLVAANQDDTASAVTNIGFDFWFDGVRQTQFSVNANGLFGLGAVAVNNGASGRTNDFATTTNNPKMSAYWDDMCTGTTGKVHFKVIGSAPNRKLVVEWLNMVQFDNGLIACSPTIRGTYQLWLFESTGVIQMVNGGTTTNDNGNGGYSVGIGSSSTSFASVTPTGPTVSYAASSNANVAAIAAGTQYTFTPNVPAAPTGLSFTAVTPLSMTLNWTDNASNEVGYAIYQSTDNVNFSFVSQTAANATSQNVSGLNPSTNYFFRVFAVTEGALSTALTGSQTTAAPGVVTSTAAGGPWSSTATWSGGVVPVNTDNVTIADGATVTIDTAAVALNVTVGTGGAAANLVWDATAARTLTVGQAVTVASNGTFQSAASGIVTTHVLSVGTDLTNNGVLDFSTSGNAAGAGITFTGAANNTFSGTGATTDIRAITINKGTSNANILELTTSNFTVQGVTTDVAGFLTLTNGTFKISGTFTVTNRVFTAAGYTIGATAGFWLNNPNFTVAGQNGSPTESGLLRISQGTFNIGTATGNSMGFSTGSTIIVEGGAVNATGRFGVAAAGNTITYTQSAGTITVCTIGNASATLGSFDLGTSATSNVNISGGTIVVQLLATAIDYRYDAGSGPAGLTGGTLQLGNAASGAAKAFNIRGDVPNLVIDNTSAGHSATFSNTLVNYFNVAALNVTINTGTTLNLNGSATSTFFFFEGSTFTNNGTLTATNVNKRFYWAGSTAQTYTGTGVTTAPVNSWELDNALGLTLSSTNNAIVNRIILFTGSVTNSNKFTLGNGGATSGTVIIGNSTTPTAAGTFDVPLTFNLGTAGELISYNRTTTSRTTGPEVNPTRTLASLTYDDNDVTHTLTIAGGDITVTGTAALTNGRVVTNANNLIIGSAGTVTRTTGYVDGNLRKTYTATGSKTYEVGTANGYSPVTVNVTGGTGDFTVKAVQGPQPNVNAATSIQRYWTLTNTTITSADLTFQYLLADVMGNENNYKVIRVSGGTPFAFPSSTVNTGTHTANVTGVTGFSDWTVGEVAAPTAASATIRGRITDSGGAPLGGVLLTLDGGQGLNTAITDREGRYTFSSVMTDHFYSLVPMRANYNFNPAVQSFSLLGNRADADFTGFSSGVAIANPLDTPEFFVRQNYLDFLGREPDAGGLAYWSNQLKACGSNAACIHNERINISAAFFMSDEFQRTGSYIYRLYKAGLGRQLDYQEFTSDHQRVVDGSDLDARRAGFATEFVQRAEFMQKYSNATSAEAFVESLLQTIQQSDGVDLSSERDALIAKYNTAGSMNEARALVLRDAIEASSLRDAEYNRAFVLTEYFGYLHRDADQEGLDFWLDVLNNRVPGNFRSMVCAFITSSEYQQKFAPVVTHSNSECGQ
ncbi:MAG TPA: DUF4214 domain-containing protein [Pyrinomonadaceae bacterium]|nr:DUF4214 domain-containing protein [Pyrinomonadaceae bacterium]